MDRVPLPPDPDAPEPVEDDFDALSVALSKEDPPVPVFGASDGFEADPDVEADAEVVWVEDGEVEPEAGLADAADDVVEAGFAVVPDGVEDAGFDDVDAVPEDDAPADDEPEDGVDEDPVAAGFSDSLAATFSGFRSMVTGRLEVPLPEEDCDVDPVVPDFDCSPEPAEPEEEDLPLAGSFSDAISTPPVPDQGVSHPTIHTCPPENTVARDAFPQCGNQDSTGLG